MEADKSLDALAAGKAEAPEGDITRREDMEFLNRKM